MPNDQQITQSLVAKLRAKASVMEMGERIAWGSDTALMREAADEIERLQGELERTEDALMAESDNNAVLANL